MFSIVSKVRDFLSLKERKRAILLLALIIVMAFIDMLGVASIMPFMAVLSRPEIIDSNAILTNVYTNLGFSNKNDFMFFLGVAVFIILIISISFKAFTTWLMLRYSRLLEYSISKRFVELYLRQSYAWYLNRHSADLGKTVLDEVGRVVGGAVMPLLDLIAQGCVVTALIVLLIVTNPILALVGGLGMGIVYALIYSFVRRSLTYYGEERRLSNQLRFMVLGEVFSGIKDVKVAGIEQMYLRRFEQPAYRFAIAQGAAQIVSQLPRYFMEILAFGGILGIMLFLMHSSGGLKEALPVLSLYALAGYRLMPSMQALFIDFAALRFGTTTLNQLHSELKVLEQTPPPISAPSIKLFHQISLDNVTYQYPGAANPSLRSLTLNFKAFTTTGIVGTTGSGKTTAVDVILGLLKPLSGQLKVDDTAINDINITGWQSGVGYVPQNIFLADDTVAANIAFGVPNNEIDMTAVVCAAKTANLHDFVVNNLPEGYDTPVGERGIRLSGGQRQRIGIARALYRQPQLLIFDEATSALDNITEHAVMEAVHNLDHQLTIILIAHRLTTVKECDKIYMLDQGQLVAQGSYDELLENHTVLRNLANLTEQSAQGTGSLP